MPEHRDTVFKDPIYAKQPFEFSKEVADVFENMLNRSVPCYGHIQFLIQQLSQQYIQPHSTVFDIGCSTGDTLSKIRNSCSQEGVSYVGIDTSLEMLQKARETFVGCDDVTFTSKSVSEASFEGASLVVSNLTLQFIPIQERSAVIQRLYKDLAKGGAFLYFEKTKEDSDEMESVMTSVYESYKFENGYSLDEIAHKKEALKTVLRPLSRTDNHNLLANAGFKTITPIFQWMNFFGLIGVK